MRPPCIILMLALAAPLGLPAQVRIAKPVPPAAATTVATAPARGLVEFPLSVGSIVYLRRDIPSNYGTLGPGMKFERESRGGQLVLVETILEFGTPRLPFDPKPLVAAGERVYSNEAGLVVGAPRYATINSTLAWIPVYLLRPVDDPPRSSRISPARFAAADLVARSAAPPPALRRLRASLPPQGHRGTLCGLDPGATTVGLPEELRNFVCFVLENGQGVTTPGGLRLFQRGYLLEIWRGDTLSDTSSGVVLRDAAGGIWLLEFKGYR